LTVEKKLGTLRLRAEKSNLQEGTVSTATTPGTDEFDPIFQLCDRAFKPGPIDLLEEPSGRLIKRSLGRECQLVKKMHDSMTQSLSGLASLTNENICIQACLLILLKNIETIFLRKGEFANPFFPIQRKLLSFLNHPLHLLIGQVRPSNMDAIIAHPL
jgi:hypothetical protein